MSNIAFAYCACNLLQLKKHYQPRKSHRIVSVNLEGTKVPLYGAGSTITVSQTGVEVPLTLNFEIRSRGNVVGKLVKTRHRKEITCPLVLNSSRSKPYQIQKEFMHLWLISHQCPFSEFICFWECSLKLYCAKLQIIRSIWFARKAKYALGKILLTYNQSPESPLCTLLLWALCK